MTHPGPFEDSHRVIRPDPVNAEVRPEALWLEQTPAERFYIRSNFPFPPGTGEDQPLRLGGAVRQAREWTVGALLERVQRSLVVTTECASNGRTGFAPTPEGEPWRWSAVSTAEWTGVPLVELLEEADVDPEAVEILFTGRDRGAAGDASGPIHFQRSLPLEKARDPDTLVALAMNGAPIPLEHGAPLRLIVPGWYGMASVKWLESIEAITQPFRGHFQHARYRYEYADGSSAPVTVMRPRAIITDPVNNARLPAGTVRIRGWAWSGQGPIDAVEVAVGGGDDVWQPARVEVPSSRHAWHRWTFDWIPSGPGLHILRCRATDASGDRQPDHARWNRHGYGNNAIHPTYVEISAG